MFRAQFSKFTQWQFEFSCNSPKGIDSKHLECHGWYLGLHQHPKSLHLVPSWLSCTIQKLLTSWTHDRIELNVSLYLISSGQICRYEKPKFIVICLKSKKWKQRRLTWVRITGGGCINELFVIFRLWKKFLGPRVAENRDLILKNARYGGSYYISDGAFGRVLGPL